MGDSSLTFDDALLQEVSRSFYLTMHWLPAPMRPAVSIGYLLARATDSVADTSSAAIGQRQRALELMRRAVRNEADAEELELLFMMLSGALAQAQAQPSEFRLLRRFGECLAAMGQLPQVEQGLLRDVLDTIIGAQMEDLHAPRFCTDAATLAYADAVAGSVGVFWTRLGYATMGDAYASSACRQLMEEAALRYGRGLQLVNMLRDAQADAALGRVYLAGGGLPVWYERAERYLHDGVEYARRLGTFRLRFCCLLPALLGIRTLRLLCRHHGGRRKISRACVYATVAEALWRAWV